MVALGLKIDYDEAKKLVLENLENGSSYNKFLELIKYQHGDISKLPTSTHKYKIKTNSEGYITDIDAYKLGILSMHLGAGRVNKEDQIDYSAGIVLNKNINDYLEVGDTIMTLYTNKKIEDLNIDNTIFKISSQKKQKEKLILEILK